MSDTECGCDNVGGSIIIDQLTEQPQAKSTKSRKYGSRREVWDGVCEMTRAKLTRDDMFECPKTHSLKSKKRSELARVNMQSKHNMLKELPTNGNTKKVVAKMEKLAIEPEPVVKPKTKKPRKKLDASS